MPRSPLTGTVTIGTTPTRIVPMMPGRKALAVTNEDATTNMRVGTPDVTSSLGLLVAAGNSLVLDDFQGELWGVVASGSITVSFLEVIQQ